jgi:tRNA nucleotidyltransferase (CCA-adding enzyme)
MEVYLVGGAVRDQLLGLGVAERDWVIVGGSAQALLESGYRQVGRDFPVFLHPETREEYALARTERKSGTGHTGFVVKADADVTLEEDLARRDLTINAMAQDTDGVLIDLHGGEADLQRRVLRHVSEAFREDPLRVFRVARFAAVLPGFTVASATARLMRSMGASQELESLSAERVWGECRRALGGAAAARFFEVLAATGCLRPWFSELAGRVVTLPDGVADAEARYACVAGVLATADAESLSTRLKCPKATSRLAHLTARYRHVLADWLEQDAAAVYQALVAARSFKQDSHLPRVLAVVQALEGRDLGALAQLVIAATGQVTAASLSNRGHSGAALGAALTEARIEFIARAQVARTSECR